MNKTLENDLDKAKKELNELQGELPHFHALLTENERDVQRLKADKASLDAQAQARGRVQIAQEMLEQHQADIQTARAEVARLERAAEREASLAEMIRQAGLAAQHKAELDGHLAKAGKAMHRATELLLREWRAESEARQEFAQVGTELVPHFNSISNPVWAGLTNDQCVRFEEGTKALLAELRARGVPLEAAADGATGRHSSLDEYPKRELPRDELSLLLWQASLLIAGPEAQPFARFVPKPRQPIYVR